MTKIKISQEYIDNIKNYEDSIKTLKDFIEAVKTMPTMYIGHKSVSGIINCIREVFQNAVDEALRKKSPCDHIWVTIDRRNFEISIEDNGRGIPFNSIIRTYTDGHTSSNYLKEEGSGEYTSGTHGVGAKVANALSSSFKVESYILGKAKKVEFSYGYPTIIEPVDIPNNNKQGTKVSMIPNFDIMNDINKGEPVDIYELSDGVLTLIVSILPLITIGTKITYTFIELDGSSTVKEYVNKEGTKELLGDILSNPIVNPISFGDDNGTTKADISFSFDSVDFESDKIAAFANFSPCIGVHITGFTNALVRFFRNYMNNVYLKSANSNKKKKKLSITPSDIKSGLRAIVSVAHINPSFTGQAKEELDNADMEKFVYDLTIKALNEWSKENASDLNKLCKRFKELAEIRLELENGKQKLTQKYSNTLSGFPEKFTKPTGKKWEELFICEGDSAKGSMVNNRINKIQGLFPIKGKIKNAFSTPLKELLQNEEVKAIINIIGAGYGKSFDINKARFDRIIIATDADVDGAHISLLLLMLFIRLMPDLVYQGRVFRVIPPLYSVKINNKKKYFTDKLDYFEYIQSLFAKNNEIAYIKDGKKLTKHEQISLLNINSDYLYELNKVSNIYKVDAKLLELVLINRNLPLDKLINIIRSNELYRFLKIETINNTLSIIGSIEKRINTLFLNERMYEECSDIISILDKNICHTYLLNGKVASIFDIMNEFEKSEPARLQRYKGLGEMNPADLAKTVVYPAEYGGERLLVRYTIEDATKDIEKMRYYESNKGKLLENLKVTRFDIM